MIITRRRLGSWLVPLALVVVPASAQATFIFDVSLDTSPLRINPAGGLYSLDFAFTNGTLAGSNSATISNFSFGPGGAPGSSITRIGGAAGSLSTSVVLTDPGLFNDFSQTFTPGSLLSFRVTLTTNVDVPTPDQFSFSLLDRSGLPIPTTDPSTADALLVVEVTSTTPTPRVFRTDTSRTFPGGESAFNFGPPVVTVMLVPEPSSLALMGIGLTAAGAALRPGRGRLASSREDRGQVRAGVIGLSHPHPRAGVRRRPGPSPGDDRPAPPVRGLTPVWTSR